MHHCRYRIRRDSRLRFKDPEPLEMLQKGAAAASNTSARNNVAKEVEKLNKKHVELLAYDEHLRYYADMHITLNLDDG